MALEAAPDFGPHLPEETLEKYAFGRLPPGDVQAVEEHLLVCESCRERLAIEDDFAEAMQVLAKLAVPGEDSGQFGRGTAWLSRVVGGLNRPAAYIGGGAFVLVALVAIGRIALWRLPTAPRPVGSNRGVQLVALTALRGGEQSLTQAEAGYALDLSIDVNAISDSPPETGSYRLELVDTAGDSMWSGSASRVAQGRIRARMGRRLAAGIYWVRLYAPSGRLLREYGLEAR